MQEIKFRLLKDGKIVGYEKHIQTFDATIPIVTIDQIRDGILHRINGSTTEKVIAIQHSKDNMELDWFDISKGYIPHDDKEQFIGLHDKNGKEEYEGDIVIFVKSFYNDNKEYEFYVHIGKIVYSKMWCEFGIKVKTLPYKKDPFDYRDYLREFAERKILGYLHFSDIRNDEEKFIEIIGNIHENPELIEDRR